MTYVPGEGPVPAAGMIIGEAPGRTEIEQGRPFVGRSGILLGQALVALGIERNDVYITNVVKFLPLDENGKIRKPTYQEMNAGAAKLQQEIKDNQSVKILALGKTAQNFLEERGLLFTAAWHPSYVLRRHGGLSVEWLEQMQPWAEAVKNVR